MIVEKIKKEFKDSSDLIIKNINDVSVIFLESANSGDKINDYILKVLAVKRFFKKNINDLIAGPNTKEVSDIKKCEFYLVNGFTLVVYKEKVYAIETRANLYRGISSPQTQQAIYGPKDAFSENIQLNIGLIKRRIKSKHLLNEDFFIGRKTKTKVSIMYIDDVCDQKIVDEVRRRLKKIDVDGILDAGNISQFLTNENKSPFPTVIESERPDKVANDLLEGKVAIVVDTSPFVIIVPAFFFDFVNPVVDNYNKNVNINFIKIVRFLCLLITILAPGLYIALINYNQETIPLNLLLNFATQRDGVPFPAPIECFLMLMMCEVLRESDIRFPSSYGSSVSILGALIMGDAAVSAGIVSPIMIIVVAITFITSLIFTEMEMINSLRSFRFLFLFAAALSGLFGLVIAGFIFLIHICSITTFNRPYTYPLAPYDKIYINKTLLRNSRKNDKYRSSLLSSNKKKLGEN